MKNKRKWMSIIGTASVAVPLTLIATSCTFTKREEETDPQPVAPEEEEYVAPTVTYDGSTDIKPKSGVISSTLSGFHLSRKLYANETLTVTSVQVNSENAVAIKAKEKYSANTDNFSVVFSVTIPQTKLYDPATAKCKLSFEFSYNSKKVTNSLDKVFTFYYSPEWQPNSVLGSLGTYTPTYTAEGLVFEVKDLKLSRALKGADNETIGVTPVDSNIKLIGSPSVDPTTQQITLKFAVLGQDQYKDYSEDNFALDFSFKRNGIQVRDNQRVSNGKIKYERAQQAIHLQISDESVLNAKPADGLTTHNINNGALYLDRVLKESFSETLSLELINIKDKDGNDAPNALEIHFNEETEPDYVDTNLTGVYIKYNLTSGQEYTPANFTFDLRWTVKEGCTPAKKDQTGTFDNGGNHYTFVYTPIWKQKQVVSYGYDDTSRKFVTAEGSPTINIASLTDKGFKVDGQKLEDKETVQVDILPETQDSHLNVSPIIATPDSITYDETHLGFTIGFDNEYILQHAYTKISATFKLRFTFIKQIGTSEFVSDPQVIGDTFTITYTPYVMPEYQLVPTIRDPINSDDPDLDEIKPGDTLITLHGTLDRELENTDSKKDTFISATLTDPTRKDVKIINTSGSEYQKGAKITGRDIEMIVRLDGVTDYSANQQFIVSFAFTFHRYDKEGINTDYTVNVNNVHITYEGFSTSLEDYVKARTLPLSLYYVSSTTGTVTNYSSLLLNAWIVGDATPAVENDFQYYIATTWDQKIKFDSFRSSHSYDSTFRIGISDTSFAEDYNDKNTDQKLFNGQVMMNNYLFCNLTSEDVFKWETDQSQFYYEAATRTHSNRAADIYVGYINFANSWTDYGGQETNNVKWLVAFDNKLRQLNNYKHCYGHINTIIEDPETDSDKRKEEYGNFGIGGYPSHMQYEYYRAAGGKDEGLFIQMPYVDWYYSEISANNILYNTAAKLREKSSDGSGEKIISNLGYSSVRHSCPVYYTNDNGMLNRDPQIYYYYDEETGVLNREYSSAEGYDLDAMDGALVVTHDLKATGNQPKIVVAGSFWGWLANTSSSATSFVPYIDILSDSTKNLLSKYDVGLRKKSTI